jgi:hypothetical protein
MSATMTTEPEYRELVPLGDGPVSKVLAGVHARTGAAYALKVLPGRLDRRTRAELQSELGRLAALRDEAPILVADRVEKLGDGRWVLRMELCSQSLPELLASFGPLSVPDTLALGTALAEALAAAHGAGILHGGVTPGNVLFRPSGEPVLADFGLTLRHAFPADPLRAMDLLAPETVRDGSVDERSDLYGLGAILYLALSGHSPHQAAPGEQQGERLLRVLGTPVPRLARTDLPPGLGELVAALLAKDPQARPVNAATVAEQLGALYAPVAPPDEPADRPANQSTGQPAAQPADQDPEDRPADEPADQPDADRADADRADADRADADRADRSAAESTFDDFAAGRAPQAEPEPPAPLPKGEPILVFGPEGPPRRFPRPTVLAGTGALSLLAVVTVLLLLNRPVELDVPPAPPPVAASSAPPTPTRVAVQLELTEPTDRGNFVELSWRSSEPLDFAVIVAGEGEQTKTIYAHRSTTYRVPVDPVRKYCFLIQGTNGPEVYSSPPKPIRGASCTQ